MTTLRLEGHGGDHVTAVARRHGVDTIFTLSGAHVFPVYDGATTSDPPVRLVDVRHEQTAVFAAEGLAKLTRRPGLAVVTAGPGVTNTVSAMATAHANGSPLVLLGGRAPDYRWGTGSLQEMDHVPLLSPVTKQASTVHDPEDIAPSVDAAFTTATTPHRGPVFVDVPMDVLYQRCEVEQQTSPATEAVEPGPASVDAAVDVIASAERPVVVLGSDVWTGAAEEAAVRLVTGLGLPTVTNGMGRGVLPRGHDLLVSRARGAALGGADAVVVVGTPLDFRLGYGAFGGRDGAPPARVVHVTDDAADLATHVDLAAGVSGDLTACLDALTDGLRRRGIRSTATPWAERLRDTARAAVAADQELLTADADPVHPARVYGELLPRLADDAVVIGDGGDFVSFAGRFVEPSRPGGWLDPGPFGCLGTGLGYAVAARLARPSSQVVLLLGDGAAGFSLMDVDTLVRHGLPVVMVCGNNGAWGLEKHPMRFLYGYDVVADLAPGTRYDEVVRALGGDGETVTRATDVGPALDRAFAAGVPYLVNVVTDPEVPYPRTTTGV